MLTIVIQWCLFFLCILGKLVAVCFFPVRSKICCASYRVNVMSRLKDGLLPLFRFDCVFGLSMGGWWLGWLGRDCAFPLVRMNLFPQNRGRFAVGCTKSIFLIMLWKYCINFLHSNVICSLWDGVLLSSKTIKCRKPRKVLGVAFLLSYGFLWYGVIQNVIFNVMSFHSMLCYLYFVLLWCYDDTLFSDF